MHYCEMGYGLYRSFSICLIAEVPLATKEFKVGGRKNMQECDAHSGVGQLGHNADVFSAQKKGF